MLPPARGPTFHRPQALTESGYSAPAIAGSGTIACGLAAFASVLSKTLLLARSDASAWKAEEQAHSLCAKVDGGDASNVVHLDPNRRTGS